MDDRPLLKDLRVIEIASGVAGPMAACRLGDLGADVIKVEWGDGDWVRRCPPLLEDQTSAAFFALNRGKRSVDLNIEPDTSGDSLRSLIRSADVLITDQDTKALNAMGLEGVDANICSWNPRLIVAQISAFGRQGPLADKPGSELCAQAMAGYTRYVGTRGQPAIRLGADVAGTATAIFTVQAILAALFTRQRAGQGQRVDLSLLNSLISMKTIHLAAQSDPDTFEGPRIGGAYDQPERGWATADVPITFAFGGAVGAEGRPGWVQFVKSIGLSRMLDDERFDKTGRATTGLGSKAREFKAEYETEFLKRPSAEIVAKVREFGGFASAYLTHEGMLAEAQVDGLVRSVPKGNESIRVLDVPVRFSGNNVELRGHAPRLGEHTNEVFGQLRQTATVQDK